jgi:hypothetical protein
MIKKVNQFFGVKNNDTETFPRLARVAGNKTEVIEIQRGERSVLREILGIESGMELEEMVAVASNTDVYVVCQSQTRSIRNIAPEHVTAEMEEMFDDNGNSIGYKVEPYQVLICAYVTLDPQDALVNEPSLADKKAFIEELEINTGDKVAALAAKSRAQDKASKERKEAEFAARRKDIAAKQAAYRAKLNGGTPAIETAPAADNVDLVVAEPATVNN